MPSGYIEAGRYLYTSKSIIDDDVFSRMAGGLFDDTYAGGSMYHPLMLPSPNLSSFFIERGVGTSLQLLGLQEDFVEIVLMPIQMQNYLSEQEKRVMVRYILNGIINYINSSHGNGIGSIGIDSQGTITSSNLSALAAEMNNDSALENAAEAIGMSAYGPIGAIVAGSLIGGIMGSGFNVGANVAEHTVSSLAGMAVSRASTGIIGALGITSTIGAMIASSLIGLAVSQAVSVALGLKNGFGFGGDLTGVDGAGRGLYSAHVQTTVALSIMARSFFSALGLTTDIDTDESGWSDPSAIDSSMRTQAEIDARSINYSGIAGVNTDGFGNDAGSYGSGNKNSPDATNGFGNSLGIGDGDGGHSSDGGNSSGDNDGNGTSGGMGTGGDGGDGRGADGNGGDGGGDGGD